MQKIDWKFTQTISDKILSDGLFHLTTSRHQLFKDIKYSGFGNYLISHQRKNYYIGEGKDVFKRIQQQFKPTTSTFYKNHLKQVDDNLNLKNIAIENFQVQFIPTEIGRKEIEESGITNLPTILNKFQIGKRDIYKVADQKGLWESIQKAKSEILLQAEKEIMQANFSPWFDCHVINVAGLYMVKSKSDQLIYIGESSDICDRYNTHSKTTYFSALRRHIGTEILNFELHEKNGKKKHFTDTEDLKVNEYLKTCRATFYPTHFGRYELEEYLIKKHRPLLNRKDNKDT